MSMRGLVAGLLVVLMTALGAAAPQPVVAQPAIPRTAEPVDYAVWEALARRTEAALESGTASQQALEELRARVAEKRGAFLNEQDVNRSRIQTVRNQLEALGPPPEDDRPEAEDIAERRAELEEQLARLRAPGVQAEEAFRRADGLIREIDNQLRLRQADALMQLWPSPVNPANWDEGALAGLDAAAELSREVSVNWRTAARRGQLNDNLPLIALYALIAAALLVRGRVWVWQLGIWMSERLKSRRSRQAGWLLVSTGSVILPVLGIIAIVQGLQASGMLGLRGNALVTALPQAGFAYFTAHWLGQRVFARNERGAAVLDLSEERLREGQVHSSLLGLTLALEILRIGIFAPGSVSPAASSVLQFPIIAMAGIIVLRMGQVIGGHAPQAAEGEEGPSYFDRLVRVGGKLLIGLGAGAILLAAVGYVAASNAVIWPALMSLGLIGLLLVIQMITSDLYALFMGYDSGEEALVPVLIGFALTVLALPLAAVIWGVPESALRELWTRFREGIQLGDARISPSDLITFALVFGLIYVLTRLLQGALRSSILPKTRIDRGGQTAIVSGTGYIGIFLAALIAITSAGIDLSTLAIVAGALSVGIGFGLQNIVSNFVSGVILLIERPVSEGDWIEVGGTMGIVRGISVRSTVIETFDRTDVIVPNADLISGAVTNWTRLNLTGRLIVKVQVAYGSDTHKVARILAEVAEDQPLAVLNPAPAVHFRGFGDNGLDFEIRIVLRDINFVLDVHSDINHAIARRFAAEGIEIPFAQRDLWLRNPEVLPGAKPPARPSGPRPEAGTEGEDKPRGRPTLSNMEDYAGDIDGSPEADT